MVGIAFLFTAIRLVLMISIRSLQRRVKLLMHFHRKITGS